jgi:hypothetical protein
MLHPHSSQHRAKQEEQWAGHEQGSLLVLKWVTAYTLLTFSLSVIPSTVIWTFKGMIQGGGLISLWLYKENNKLQD